MNVIVGTSGHAKDVNFLLQEINGYSPAFVIDFYISKKEELINGPIRIVSEKEFKRKYINDDNQQIINCYTAIGNPSVRRKIVKEVFNDFSSIKYPNAIHPSVSYDKRKNFILLGEGNMLFPGVRITTEVKLGSHNHINQSCTIAHGCKLGDFITLSPGVHISGETEIEDNVFIGSGAVVLENLRICKNSVIAAGAVVTNDIMESGTYVGVPAKKVEKV